jgi:lipoyl-dependent peroxiredoxin
VEVLYTAHATVTGGRDAGHGRTSDGALEVDLRMPPELGGDGGGTNPEQLFAIGYAACFEGAIKTVARREKLDADDVSIDSGVSLGPGDDRSFTIAVGLDVTLLSSMTTRRPRSSPRPIACARTPTTRGNVDVTLTANGRRLEPAPVA